MEWEESRQHPTLPHGRGSACDPDQSRDHEGALCAAQVLKKSPLPSRAQSFTAFKEALSAIIRHRSSGSDLFQTDWAVLIVRFARRQPHDHGDTPVDPGNRGGTVLADGLHERAKFGGEA